MRRILPLLVASLVLAASPARAQLIYASDRSGNLYLLDASTGTLLESLGNSGVGMLEGLAVQPATGQLFGVDRSQRLVTINRTSGSASVVGTFAATIKDIAFSADGTLYGVDRSGYFYVIDPATGGLSNQTNHAAYGGAGGLAAPPAGGDLYWRVNNQLVRVDPATLVVTGTTAAAYSRLRGMTTSCDGSVLYGANRGGNLLVTIDPATGNLTGSINVGIDLASVASDCVSLGLRTLMPAVDDSTGNGNGLIDPNELAQLQIPLRNLGGTGQTGIQATLSSSTPGITVTADFSAYADLAAGATTPNVVPFVITASPSFQHGSTIHLSLSVATNGGNAVLPVRIPTSLFYTIDRGGDYSGSISSLAILDPETGAYVARIGATGVGVVTGLAQHPSTGAMYGVTGQRSGRRLVTIDMLTGAGTVIGNLSHALTDISFRADGTLLGVTRNNQIVSINLGTGASTLLANTGTSGGGIAFGLDGSLYVSDGSSLRQLDPYTFGQTSSMTLASSDRYGALAVGCDGLLYASGRNNGMLWSIDPELGIQLPIGGQAQFRRFDSLAIRCTPAPSLRLSGTFDDPLGDHNGAADPGETIDISVTLKNRGAVGATAVTATATTSTPEVTMVVDTANVGDLAPGATSLATFRVLLGPGFVRGSTIVLQVHSSLGDGTVAVRTVPVLTGTLFGGRNDGMLYRLTQSGQVDALIGNTGMGAITGLALHPGTSVLYGVSGGRGTVRGALYAIDKTTAASSLVGAILPDGDVVTDITFTPDGTLYGVSRNGSLARIDLTTGRGTVIRSGLYYAGAIAADAAGALFYMDSSAIYAVDPLTGNRTQVGAFSAGRAQALTSLCDGGLMATTRHWDSGGGVYTFASPGASPTLLSQNGSWIDAIAMQCQRMPAIVRGPVVVSGGGADGVIDQGESANLTLNLRNFGDANASAISATLSTTTTGITIVQGSSSYPDITPAGAAANLVPYTIQASTAFVPGRTIRLLLTVTTAHGTSTVTYSVLTRTLYASGFGRGNGEVLLLDPDSSRIAGSIGSAGLGGIGGLAVHPVTHELYGVTQRGGATGVLARIDKTTGAGTVIGTVLGGQLLSDLAFAPDGTLFGLTTRRDGSQLVRIDVSTGVGTVVGAVSGASGGGLAFSPSGELWQASDNTLRRLNPTTAAVLQTRGASINDRFAALAFACDGTLYGGARNGGVWLLNERTGLSQRNASMGMLEALAWDCKPTVGLSYSSSAIDDSTGNNDGAFDANETVNLNVVVRNGGALTGTGISAVLSTSTPGVTLPGNTSTYGNTAAGASTTNDTPFVIHLGNGFIRGTRVLFVLTLTTDQGTFPIEFAVRTGASILYGGDRSGTLYEIDPEFGTTTALGNTGVGNLEALAVQPGTGVLFGVNRSFQLLTIDKVTAASTLVASLGVSIVDLTFTPNGTLHGVDRNGNFYTIDPATGAVSNQTYNGGYGGGGGLAASPTGDALYWHINNNLLRLDPTTRSVTSSIGTGVYRVRGLTMSCDGSALYGSSRGGNQLLSLDPATGAVQTIAVGADLNGLGMLVDGCVPSTPADQTAPVISGTPSDFSVEATSPAGAVVTYVSPTANDDVDGPVAVSCDPASGTTRALGAHVVTCTATDAAQNTATTSFTATVVDTTPPLINGTPADFSVEATGPSGAVVTYVLPTATDIVAGTVAVICSPVSGTTLALGAHLVTCTATDAATNTSETSFTATVADTTRPTINGTPANFSVEATGPSGAVVTYVLPTATDIVAGTVAVICSPVSGTTLALGAHLVTCTATDTATNTSETSFTATVADTTRPTISGTPANFSVEATGPAGAVVTYVLPTATDIVDGSVAVNCTPASGTTLALGAHLVTCTATDAATNTVQTSFTATVVDTTPPALTLPADFGVVFGAPVTYVASANDLVDGAVAVSCSPASGSGFPVGTTTVSCSATDSRTNTANGSFKVANQFASACNDGPGRQVLSPIKADGTTVMRKNGSTVPVKFRVCDAAGNSVSTPVVSSFLLTQIINGTVTTEPNTEVVSTNDDATFRWSTSDRFWMFNLSTQPYAAGATHVFRIGLIDGTSIQFQVGLR